MKHTYTATHHGVTIGTFETYAMANQRVLDHSGKGRIWDAVGYHVRGTKPHLTRMLINTPGQSSRLMSQIGPRVTAHYSWGDAYRCCNECAWYLERGHDLHIQLVACFSDGKRERVTLRVSQPNEGNKTTIGYQTLYSLFDHIAHTHEINDIHVDWPEGM